MSALGKCPKCGKMAETRKLIAGEYITTHENKKLPDCKWSVLEGQDPGNPKQRKRYTGFKSGSIRGAEQAFGTSVPGVKIIKG